MILLPNKEWKVMSPGSKYLDISKHLFKEVGTWDLL